MNIACPACYPGQLNLNDLHCISQRDPGDRFCQRLKLTIILTFWVDCVGSRILSVSVLLNRQHTIFFVLFVIKCI